MSIALGALCPIAWSQTSLGVKSTNCNTISVSLSEPKDSAAFQVVWLEKQIGPGIWKNFKHYTTKERTVVFPNLSAGQYRVICLDDNHENIIYNPKMEAQTDRVAAGYITLDDCSQSTIASQKDLTSSQIKIFPNPASNTLFLEFPKQTLSDNTWLELTDITGRKVLVAKVSSDAAQIDISSVPAGTYSATIRSSEMPLLYKLIIVQK